MSHAGSHILIVDDEPNIRKLLAGVLEDEGLRRDLRERGYERSRSFTRGALLPRLLEIYRRAAQRSNIEP